jgi:hypothetical protein
MHSADLTRCLDKPVATAYRGTSVGGSNSPEGERQGEHREQTASVRHRSIEAITPSSPPG